MTGPGPSSHFSRRLSVLVIAALILLDLLLASRATAPREPRAESVAPATPAAPAPEPEKPCSSQASGPWLP